MIETTPGRGRSRSSRVATPHERWAFVHVLTIGAAGFSSFYLLLAVLPALVVERGGGKTGAGLAMGAFLAATVLAQAVTPWLLARTSPRAALAAGLLLLSAPALAYPASRDVASVSALSAVRGAGFGILTVVTTRLVAVVSQSDRSGRAFGLYGLATSTMGVVLPSLGLLMFQRWSVTTVALLAAVAGAAALAVTIRVGSRWRHADATHSSIATVAADVQSHGRLHWQRPLIAFFPCAVAYGSTYTLMPVLDRGAAARTLAMFGLGVAGGRVLWGRLSDSAPGSLTFSAPLLATSAGEALLAEASGVGLAAAALLLGLSIGAAATGSLVTAVRWAPPGREDAVSARWNITFDAGAGVGSVALGALADHWDGRAVVALPSALALAAFCLLVALRPRRRRRAGWHEPGSTADAAGPVPAG